MSFDLQWADLATIGLLIFLEGVLSIDNAVVLALLAKELPEKERPKALSYGMIGAVLFRIAAISSATFLLHIVWVKVLGGLYLLYLSGNYFFKKNRHHQKQRTSKKYGFWTTVALIELTDIAFAMDSILSAVALSKKILVVMIGGIIGLLLMRYAATLFLRILERFPRFESTAYLLVFVIGGKLLLETLDYPALNFHSPNHPAFWIFWLSMLIALGFGFTGKKEN